MTLKDFIDALAGKLADKFEGSNPTSDEVFNFICEESYKILSKNHAQRN